MRLKCILLTFVALLLSISVYSTNKSDRLRPQWVTKQIPESNNSSYFFLDAQGNGRSLDVARQSAIANLTTRLMTERGIKVNTALQTKSRTTTTSDYNEMDGVNKKYQYQEVQDFEMEVIEEGDPIKINCRTIDEYWVEKDGVYTINILYCIENKKGYAKMHDAISTTTSYPYAGFLSIIPGAGQMYKGDYAKGIPFLVTGIAGATGIILCESTRAAYRAKAVQQPQYAQQYQTRANNWGTGTYVCAGITGGIWLWNIIDAFVAKGARRVVVKMNNGNFSMTPTIQYNPIYHSTELGYGVQYNF